MRSRIPPAERARLAAEGLLDRGPLPCEVCGRPMEPGETVLCDDGYERIYGEFVLGPVDDLHEDNWPVAHARCAAEADAAFARGEVADEEPLPDIPLPWRPLR